MAAPFPTRGDWTSRQIPTKASTTYLQGQFLYDDGTDIVPAVSTTENIYGITMQAKASAANTNPLSVLIPRSPECQFYSDVSGTLTAAMVGRTFDLLDSQTVNQAATTYKPVVCAKFISATAGEFSINYTKGADNT